MKILLIENEKWLAQSMQEFLSAKGFRVETVCDGETGAEYAVFHFESISHPFLQMGRPRMFGVTLNINL